MKKKKLLKLINKSVVCLENRGHTNRVAINELHNHAGEALAEIYEALNLIKRCVVAKPKKNKGVRREEITLDDEAQWRSVHMDSKIPSDTSTGHFFYEWAE